MRQILGFPASHITSPITSHLASFVAAALLSISIAVPSAQAQNIKIGVLFPTKTVNGKQGVQGAQLAVDMVNAEGGVLGGRKLELVSYDTNLSPVEGVAAVQRMIDQDKIKIITGELSSSVSLAVIPVIKGEGALFMAAIPKHPDVTKSGYDRVFRLNSTNPMDSAAFDPVLKAKAAGKKVALISENNDFGKLVIDSYKQLFGPQVVFSDMIAMNQTDFTSIVTNLRQANPDLTCIASSNAEQWSNILRVMSDFKIKTQLCIMPGLINADGVKLAGKSAEGLFSADIYTPTMDNPLNHKFVSAFQAKNGKVPEKVEALAFEAVWITAEAIKKAGTADDMGKLAATIRAGSWTTPRGVVKFDAQGQATTGDLARLEVKNGAIVQVAK